VVDHKKRKNDRNKNNYSLYIIYEEPATLFPQGLISPHFVDRQLTSLISAIISFGSLVDVVFILHVNLNDLGFI
jgi:hypothetical protein